ncbi:MAG: hypothetical protein KKH92_03970 [Firmicutes bacterium]|nr:hypothetical protein [Bacillota bacterium]
MRCKFCGKNNDDSAILCETCGGILNAEVASKKGYKETGDGINLLVTISFLMMAAGIVFFIINLFKGVVDFIVITFFVVNALVLLSIDKRLSKLEEENRLNQIKNNKS